MESNTIKSITDVMKDNPAALKELLKFAAPAWYWAVKMSGAFAIAIAAFGGAIGQGKAAAAAVDAIARQPEAQQDIFTTLILSLALIESLVIYALAVSLVLIFVI
jgi:F-type H+-transporting ATPase subunit c